MKSFTLTCLEARVVLVGVGASDNARHAWRYTLDLLEVQDEMS